MKIHWPTLRLKPINLLTLGRNNMTQTFKVYALKSVELVIEIEADTPYEAMTIARGKDGVDFDEVPMSDAWEIIDVTPVE